MDIVPPAEGWGSVDINNEAKAHKDINAEITRQSNEALEIERRIRTGFEGQHTGIDNLLRTLSLTNCSHSYEAFASVFERLDGQCKTLQDFVRVLQSDLEQLDNKKEHVIFHTFTQGERLYSELKKISESSRVRLAPGKASQQTLKIGVPDELDPNAEERIRLYVDNCLADMRRNKKEDGFTEKTLRSSIDAKFSNREILNQTIGQHTIDVKLLKVDASQANTKLRTWESVLTDNSGGELFVSCFALLSALMDYSRKSVLAEGALGSGTKVMLIDNPFGKTSSNHLLDALIQVAKQFDMQMLCLSDLSQSSITAKFALIYQLSLRPALYSGKSYLKTDSVSKNELVYKDNKLENVSVYEQMRFF
jgi:hypothetical protein